jgi:lipopolysaccharide export system permease protein
MQLLEMLEVTPAVLERKLGVQGLLHYAVLRIPGQMLLMLPLAGLLGCMSAFYAMARTREITALRTAGVGLARLLVYLLPVPILFALVQFGLSQYVVPPAESSLRTWWESTTPLENKPADPQWVRTSNGILLFERSSADGSKLLEVRIYDRDQQGLLVLRTHAKRAEWDGSRWQLDDARDTRVEPGTASAGAASRSWNSNLRPDDVVQLDEPDPHLSNVALADVIGGERVKTRQTSFYMTVLVQSFTAPFAVFIMMLLAMPAAIVSERGGGGVRVLVALGLGLGFVLVDGIFSAFGTSGRISPLIAATAAPLLFAICGAWQLRSCERA